MKYRTKFIYLISPDKIYKNFYDDLREILKSNKIKYFQLRQKNSSKKEILLAAYKIKKICKSFKVKFIINDYPLIAKKVRADGCHLGQGDMKISEARELLKNKIIGITCQNSVKLLNKALENKPDYIAIGAFNKSNTKKTKHKATLNHLKIFRKITKKPIVAIGGINQNNYKKLLLNKADFLAISSFVWNNKYLKPIDAIKKLK